jgi:hypothetical protein
MVVATAQTSIHGPPCIKSGSLFNHPFYKTIGFHDLIIESTLFLKSEKHHSLLDYILQNEKIFNRAPGAPYGSRGFTLWLLINCTRWRRWGNQSILTVPELHESDFAMSKMRWEYG